MQANSDIIDAVYVSTDDSTIKAIALAFGAQVIDRPAYFREILNQPLLCNMYCNRFMMKLKM
jgi:CMP-N-acetylneuraminic acid synthetase